MTPEEAVERALKEIRARPDLRIVAVAGPGEPLANPETFETLGRLHALAPTMKGCISTNGLALEENVERLVGLGVETVTVSMSALSPGVAAHVYEWVTVGGQRLRGLRAGREMVRRQLRGMGRAVTAGLHVKVNSVLIPGVNEADIVLLAARLAEVGVCLHNVIPLVPCGSLADRVPPTGQELQRIRALCARYVRQFHHCAQCRSDVVGVPGASDTVL